MKKLASLSLIFPAHNDAPALPRLVEEAFRQASACAENFEVIVVNDASQDDTDEVLERLRGRLGSRLRVVRHEKNRGYGGALRSGFQASGHEFVFYTDGDAQYDMADLPKLVERMRPGIGLVNGYKISRSDAWYRALLGAVYLFVVRHLFWLKIRDVDCGPAGHLQSGWRDQPHPQAEATFAAIRELKASGPVFLVSCTPFVSWRKVAYYFPEDPLLVLSECPGGSRDLDAVWVSWRRKTGPPSTRNGEILLPAGRKIVWLLPEDSRVRMGLEQAAPLRRHGPLFYADLTLGGEFEFDDYRFRVEHGNGAQ